MSRLSKRANHYGQSLIIKKLCFLKKVLKIENKWKARGSFKQTMKTVSSSIFANYAKIFANSKTKIFLLNDTVLQN